MTSESYHLGATPTLMDTRSKNLWRTAETRVGLGVTVFLALNRSSCQACTRTGFKFGIHDLCIHPSCHRLSGYLVALPRGYLQRVTIGSLSGLDSLPPRRAAASKTGKDYAFH